jgi:hypothetical protein
MSDEDEYVPRQGRSPCVQRALPTPGHGSPPLASPIGSPKGSKPVARIGSPGLAQMTRRAPEMPGTRLRLAWPWEAITAGDGLPAAV